jgi:hypothetical protein
MSSRSDAAGSRPSPWRNGRLFRGRATASDATDRQSGVHTPDVVEEFLRERALDGLFEDRDGECPCGSGKSYWECHGKRAEG